MFSLTFAGASVADSLHDAELIKCSFKPDVGVLKSMQATCSAYPEQTFSTRYTQHDSTDHCRTRPLRESSAYRDLEIKLPVKLVTWKHDLVADPDEKAKIILRAVQEDSISEDEAESRYEKNLITDKIAYIGSAQKIFDKLLYDPISEELYDKPVLRPALLVLFADQSSNNFSVYVSANLDAILSEYVSFDDHSWLTMSFGRCSF